MVPFSINKHLSSSSNMSWVKTNELILSEAKLNLTWLSSAHFSNEPVNEAKLKLKWAPAQAEPGWAGKAHDLGSSTAQN